MEGSVPMIYSFIFGSAAIAGLAAYPPVFERIRSHVDQVTDQAAAQMEDMFLEGNKKRLMLIYFAVPTVFGALGFAVAGWMLAAVMAAFGVILPRVLLAYMRRQRKKKFHGQLVDSLLLLSSCLRAGLSMLQAFQVLVEEMPAPMSQEFGLVLKETRMGVAFEDALIHMKQRMPSDDLTLFVTTVLVARETGGDVTSLFARLVETIRERKKLREKIASLTFMSRAQAILMAILPFVFTYVIWQIDKSHFTFFINDPMGRLLIALAVFIQIVNFLLCLRFTRSPL